MLAGALGRFVRPLSGVLRHLFEPVQALALLSSCCVGTGLLMGHCAAREFDPQRAPTKQLPSTAGMCAHVVVSRC